MSGGTIALLGSVGDAMKNIANIPTDVIRAIRSPPESQSIDQTLEDTSTIPTGKPRDKASKAAIATSKNVGRVLETSLTAPMAFTLGMSQGFRNVPRLYGEKSRPVDNVTGWQSGLKTAGKVLVSFCIFLLLQRCHYAVASLLTSALPRENANHQKDIDD